MAYILILGDSHIPRRAKSIPEKLKIKILSLSEDRNFDHILFTGDLIKAPKLIEFLMSRSNQGVYTVLGNMDYYEGKRDLPVYLEIKLDFPENKNLVIGLTHGANIKPRGDKSQLESLAQSKGCNILVSGHTHKEEIFLSPKGILLINPGSCTGAWSFIASQIPSFVTIDTKENQNDFKVILYQLETFNDNFNIIPFDFTFSNNKIRFL
ncbi:MAG: YfcE family phosphodiesterase [Promethearchaeota archaeon]